MILNEFAVQIIASLNLNYERTVVVQCVSLRGNLRNCKFCKILALDEESPDIFDVLNYLESETVMNCPQAWWINNSSII